MKKVFVLAMCLFLLFSSVNVYALVASAQPQYDRSLFSVVENYLSDYASSLYGNGCADLSVYTIESATSSDSSYKLSQYAEYYPAFISSCEGLLYESFQLSINSLDDMLESVKLSDKSLTYYKHIDEAYDTSYKYYNARYCVDSYLSNGSFAFFDLTENIEFEYTELDEPSYMLTHYNFSLVQYQGKWYICSIVSDSEFCSEFLGKDVDLQYILRGIDAACQEVDSEMTFSRESSSASSPSGVRTILDREYIPSNAVSYALTYSVTNFDLHTPSFRNPRFHYGTADCMRFASQCVWAGFGGSNSQTQIDAKHCMDTSGSKTWYCTSSEDDSAWRYTTTFKNNATYINAHTSESGIHSDTYTVGHSQNVLTGGSVTQSELYGAVLLVKGGQGSYHHAIILTRVNGNTRSTVYFTAYNRCAKNVKLSSRFPASADDEECGVFVIVPHFLSGANVASGDYLYGDLVDAQSLGTSLTVTGRASANQPTLQVKVYPPSSSTASYTFSGHICNAVSGTILLNQSGEWRIVVSSTLLSDSYTYTIRVKSTVE